MLRPGASRQQLARTLNAAYARGLLSETTLSHRLDVLFGASVVDPAGLIGDLAYRRRRREWRAWIVSLFAAAARIVNRANEPTGGAPPRLLALDWSGGQEELLLGREMTCDVVLSDLTVSRRHARLVFRDGSWLIQDLKSTNGTEVNGVSIGRYELRPGDHVVLGNERLQID